MRQLADFQSHPFVGIEWTLRPLHLGRKAHYRMKPRIKAEGIRTVESYSREETYDLMYPKNFPPFSSGGRYTALPIGEMPAKAQRAAAEFNGNERHIAPSLAGLRFRLRLETGNIDRRGAIWSCDNRYKIREWNDR